MTRNRSVRKDRSQSVVAAWKIHLSLDHETGDPWIDNGLAEMCALFGEGEWDGREILEGLLQRLVQPTKNKGQYYDEVAGTLREYQKRNWVFPANLFIKVTGSAPKRVIGGVTHFAQPPRFELAIHPSSRPDTCDMCGERGPVDDAKMWMYPFIVDPERFANFYSRGRRGVKLCVRCALAGLAGYTAWLYRVHGRDAIHLFLFHADTRDLFAFRAEVVRSLRVSDIRGGNIQPELWGAYIHETTLGLILRLFRYVDEPGTLSDEGRNLLARVLQVSTDAPPVSLRLYAITGKPAQAFDMQAVREFSRLNTLFHVYRSCLKAIEERSGADWEHSPHATFVNVFRQFSRREPDGGEESIWRDRIAQAVLAFEDPFEAIEAFLYDVRAKERRPSPLVWGTDLVFERYGKEVLGLEERLLEVLRGFGFSLGTGAQRDNELGLLYGIRNAKRPEEFYRVLNDVQYRLQLTVPESLLQIGSDGRIMGGPWVLVKTLLSIYAMNAYLRANRPQEKSAAGGKTA